MDVNYLHFDYVYPLKTEKLKAFIAANDHVCILENNATGQLHQLMQKEGIHIQNDLLKRNGRPFFVEDIQEYVEKHT
jgi:2-oxoglutarate ferredoxin oxidoreductase subunit alpha